MIWQRHWKIPLASCALCCSNPDKNTQVSGAGLLGKRGKGRGGEQYQLNSVLLAADTCTYVGISPTLTNHFVETSTFFLLVPVIRIVIFLNRNKLLVLGVQPSRARTVTAVESRPPFPSLVKGCSFSSFPIAVLQLHAVQQ